MKFFKPDNLPNNVYRAPAWEMALYVILNPSIVHLIASLVPIPSALGFYRINSPEMLRVCWMSIFIGPIPLYGYNRVFDLHLHYNSHMTWLTSLNAIDLSVIIFNDDFDDARRFFPFLFLLDISYCNNCQMEAKFRIETRGRYQTKLLWWADLNRCDLNHIGILLSPYFDKSRSYAHWETRRVSFLAIRIPLGNKAF